MDWKWVALAVVADLGVYLLQAYRWSLLLRPWNRWASGGPRAPSTSDLFANEVLPGHAGEILRCYLLSIWTALPFSVSLSSALIERVFDGIWLSLCLL